MCAFTTLNPGPARLDAPGGGYGIKSRSAGRPN